LVPDHRLSEYVNKNLAESSTKLLIEQKISWEQCRTGYNTLNSVQVKKFEFDGFEIRIQFNPGRLTSSSAKVDPESIRERRCFLCVDNLPAEQKGILYEDKYLVLCNPFPIFPEHFTIPSIEHKPQRILSSFNDFLTITKDFSSKYLVFYNGPKCGASAPDHFHFQAGNNNFLPLITGYPDLKSKYSEVIYSNKTEISHLEDGLRKLLIIEGDSPAEIQHAFNVIYREFEKLSPPGEEPLMNIISIYDHQWKVIIILRERHRPARFFEEGERNILLSPASVDLGGVCITPLEKDYKR
jgi:hypothetical protein